jgi:N-methylhydantoinase A
VSGKPFRVGSDIGGTFTDLWVVADDGRTETVKTPTTADVIGGVLAALSLAAEAFEMSTEEFCAGIEHIGHGTTVALNALLTGAYAKTAILTNEGFADTLEIGRLRRQYTGLSETEVSDYFLRGRWPPLVPRRRVVEIRGRIDVEGDELQPLDEAGAVARITELRRDGVEAVAICLLWATANRGHEQRLHELLVEHFPEAAVSASHAVAPTIGEYARMSTTAANAALKPVAGRYLRRFGEALAERGVRAPPLMMTSAGGVVPAEHLSERPVLGLFSGPSAGVIAAQQIGAALGRDDLLTIDLGGTSFDVGLIVGGRPLMTSEISLAGADIRVPSIDVRAIGAGGGSLARVEQGELLVGPASAGAEPGPACYGRGGTQPTATDADLVLGILDPDNFVGGRMQLDVQAARRAIEAHVARPLGVSIEEAAWGIREVLDSRMSDLLRQVTIARGHDPREFTIIAGGGGGPSHAWTLARELGVREVIVPAFATAQSAYGTCASDIRMNVERTAAVRIPTNGAVAAAQAEAVAGALEEAVQCALGALDSRSGHDGRAEHSLDLERTLAICYRGQVSTLDVDVDDGRPLDPRELEACLERFQAQYERLFGAGAAFPEAGYMVASARATAIAPLSAPRPPATGSPLRRCGSRPVIFDDPRHPVDTAIYQARTPATGQRITGPALVEYPGHTVVVPPGGSARSDHHGNLVLTPEQA